MRPCGTAPIRDAGPGVVHVCARARRFTLALGRFALALGLIASCRTTADPIGYNGSAGLPLGPLRGPSSAYPNPFRDRGHTDAEITAKINAAYMQLFHGTGADQPIYFPDPNNPNAAFIMDILHGDRRTEGIGLGMLIAVELNHQTELDSLWRYAKTALREPSGYFLSFCENPTTMPCLDPFGLQQMTMALILAHDQYPPTDASATAIDYGADARELLTLMRHKVDQSGIADGITDTFDHATNLVFDLPLTTAGSVGRPSIEMPGYYELWKQATGDPFWTLASKAARDYWRCTANPTTGLTPVRATFAGCPGVPVSGSDGFASEAYRAQIAMALDQIWTGGDGWSRDEANRLLGFFSGQGPNYAMSFTLDGTPVLTTHDPALVSANGISAAIATIPATQKAPFVDEVWNLPIPTGANRYFGGLLYLVALLVMGGHMQVL
jgi:oligosaccharide reducing-end xylanase